MSESAGRVVAWQVRHYYDDKWGGWYSTSQNFHIIYGAGRDDLETRALVPEQLLVEAESEIAAWRAACMDNGARWTAANSKLQDAESKLSAVLALADRLKKYVEDNVDVEMDARELAIWDTYDLIEQELRALTEKSEETR